MAVPVKLTALDIAEVSAVDDPASGYPFLIYKAKHGAGEVSYSLRTDQTLSAALANIRTVARAEGASEEVRKSAEDSLVASVLREAYDTSLSGGDVVLHPPTPVAIDSSTSRLHGLLFKSRR